MTFEDKLTSYRGYHHHYKRVSESETWVMCVSLGSSLTGPAVSITHTHTHTHTHTQLLDRPVYDVPNQCLALDLLMSPTGVLPIRTIY